MKVNEPSSDLLIYQTNPRSRNKQWSTSARNKFRTVASKVMAKRVYIGKPSNKIDKLTSRQFNLIERDKASTYVLLLASRLETYYYEKLKPDWTNYCDIHRLKRFAQYFPINMKVMLLKTLVLHHFHSVWPCDEWLGRPLIFQLDFSVLCSGSLLSSAL